MWIRDRLRRFMRVGLALLRRLEPIAPLLTRIVIGYAFVRTGWGKWQHFDRTVDYFAAWGIPAAGLSAAVVATAELVGGVLLCVGLWTRVWAGILSGVMVVALASADRAAFGGALVSGGATLVEVVPFVFLVFLLWLLAFGAGPFSLDRLIREGQVHEPPTSETRESPRASNLTVHHE